MNKIHYSFPASLRRCLRLMGKISADSARRRLVRECAAYDLPNLRHSIDTLERERNNGTTLHKVSRRVVNASASPALKIEVVLARELDVHEFHLDANNL